MKCRYGDRQRTTIAGIMAFKHGVDSEANTLPNHLHYLRTFCSRGQVFGLSTFFDRGTCFTNPQRC